MSFKIRDFDSRGTCSLHDYASTVRKIPVVRQEEAALCQMVLSAEPFFSKWTCGVLKSRLHPYTFSKVTGRLGKNSHSSETSNHNICIFLNVYVLTKYL